MSDRSVRLASTIARDGSERITAGFFGVSQVGVSILLRSLAFSIGVLATVGAAVAIAVLQVGGRLAEIAGRGADPRRRAAETTGSVLAVVDAIAPITTSMVDRSDEIARRFTQNAGWAAFVLATASIFVEYVPLSIGFLAASTMCLVVAGWEIHAWLSEPETDVRRRLAEVTGRW